MGDDSLLEEKIKKFQGKVRSAGNISFGILPLTRISEYTKKVQKNNNSTSRSFCLPDSSACSDHRIPISGTTVPPMDHIQKKENDLPPFRASKRQVTSKISSTCSLCSCYPKVSSGPDSLKVVAALAVQKSIMDNETIQKAAQLAAGQAVAMTVLSEGGTLEAAAAMASVTALSIGARQDVAARIAGRAAMDAALVHVDPNSGGCCSNHSPPETKAILGRTGGHAAGLAMLECGGSLQEASNVARISALEGGSTEEEAAVIAAEVAAAAAFLHSGSVEDTGRVAALAAVDLGASKIAAAALSAKVAARAYMVHHSGFGCDESHNGGHVNELLNLFGSKSTRQGAIKRSHQTNTTSQFSCCFGQKDKNTEEVYNSKDPHLPGRIREAGLAAGLAMLGMGCSVDEAYQAAYKACMHEGTTSKEALSITLL